MRRKEGEAEKVEPQDEQEDRKQQRRRRRRRRRRKRRKRRRAEEERRSGGGAKGEVGWNTKQPIERRKTSLRPVRRKKTKKISVSANLEVKQMLQTCGRPAPPAPEQHNARKNSTTACEMAKLLTRANLAFFFFFFSSSSSSCPFLSS